MKKILATALALAVGFGTVAASATPISHSLKINATVDPGCTANGPTGTAGFSFSGTSSTFTTAVSGTTQAPASGTLTFGSLVCTTPKVKITLSSARMGLFVDGTEGNAGVKKMNYLATAKLNSTTLTELSTHQGVNNKTGNANLGTGANTITIAITFPGSVSELIPAGELTAGTYSDTLTINIDGLAA
ncbi:MAG: spore coat protein U domain-containing protein [Rhodomicrobiaceae bacterium]